eukprot:4371618-Amphidinium_carterae.1
MQNRAEHSAALWQAGAQLVGVVGAIGESLVLKVASDVDPLPPVEGWVFGGDIRAEARIAGRDGGQGWLPPEWL